MRILLGAVGTRSDVQPALVLALELRKLWHAARMCTSPNFVDWAKSLGLEALPMGVAMRMPALGPGAPPKLTPEELRRLRESMPDLITDPSLRLWARPSTAVMSSSAPTRTSTRRRRSPNIGASAV